MNDEIFAPVSLVDLWVNHLSFDIDNDPGDSVDSMLTVEVGATKENDPECFTDGVRATLRVSNDIAPKGSENVVSSVSINATCIVRANKTDEISQESLDSYLLQNAISFLYAEIRSRVAKLYSGSLFGKRIQLPTIVPAVIAKDFRFSDVEDSQ